MADTQERIRQENTVSELSLAVEIREQTGKGASRRLRAVGRIPGVVYGHGKQTVSIMLKSDELERLIKTSHAGLNTLFSLRGDTLVDGRTVLVKELQREPVKGAPLHADLFEVDLNERLRVSVPIRTRGTARGVSLGGLLEHLMREIELDCLPNKIPDEIVVDVTELDIGDTIHVADLELPEEVELQASGDLPVVSVAVTRVHEAEEAVAAEEEEAKEAAAEGTPDEEPGGKPPAQASSSD